MRIEGDRSTILVPWAVSAWGGIAAVLTAPIAAAIVGILLRFPIPFGDYASGLGDTINALMASIFYLVMGEGVALAALGGTAGYFISKAIGPWLIRGLICAVVAGFGLALIGALLIAAVG
ncbi:hypothetical protein OHB26_02390 [Nocardia sp. NBC_01503]|uniref:hypothetical protein n=1 Tax=Nocardia sp. NBC_01503 TaxID=2975997 RepID=UPI002E7AD124|nr:hypothetical protein [Nocardia sp. NBC_01503]WTL33126.1 hypothetical protein OHB26_02390 [Nocardia sp. NBC_01503]